MRAAAFAVPAFLVLAGCAGASGNLYVPGTGYEETGRTLHFVMSVVDLFGQKIYPGYNTDKQETEGLRANMWAFCVTPFDPNDQASVDAIEYWNPLPTDVSPSNSDGSPSSLSGKCSVPGPTIHARQGDRIVVEFSHSHFHPHTIHWHGQYVPWGMDGVPGVTQEAVASGDKITYSFIAKRAGTLWYHCHVDTQFHVMQGLYGAFIVDPQDTSQEPDVSEDFIWVLSTARRELFEYIQGVNPHRHPAGCFTSGTPGCPNPPALVAPDVFMINGHSFPYTLEHHQEDGKRGTLIEIEEGQRIRLRLLNAGTTWEAIHLHGHDMLVTHRDGNPLQAGARFYVDTLSIGPAERYDVMIEGTNPGPWVIHTHVNTHETNDHQTPGGMHGMMVYPEFHDKMHEFPVELPGGQAPRVPQVAPGDFFNTTTRTLARGAAATVSQDWSFPISPACAVKKVEVNVHVQVPTTPGQTPQQVLDLLQALTVTIARPADALPMPTTHPVTGNAPPSFGPKVPDANGNVRFEVPVEWGGFLSDGKYTVQIRGLASEAWASESVLVDYYDTLEEANLNGHKYLYTDCFLYHNTEAA